MIKKTIKSALLLAVVSCMFGSATVKAQQTLADAITFTKNEQYDKAEALFQQLIKGDPGNSKLYFYYGENTLLNYFADTISNSLSVTAKEAKDLFNKGVSANASDPLNYVGLAKVAFYQGDNAKADEMRAKAKSLLPPYKKVTKIANPKEYAFTLAKIAESYIRFEQVDTSKAMPFIREALKIDPRNSEVYIITGDIYILVNDGSKAIKNYNLAQDWDLKSPTANMKIGSIYVKGRNLMAAIPFYQQAIALNQDYAPAYRELGQLYSMAGKYKESKQYFEKYLELTKGNIPAKIRYVNALFYAKEYGEVIKNVEEIFAVDNSRAYMNRIAGYSCYEQGDYDQALAYMDKLFATLPADRIIKKDYIYYARILVKKNQNYSKLVLDTDKDQSEADKQLDKLTGMKPGPAKDKAKADLETLKAKIAASKATLQKEDAELNRAFEAYDKAINFEGGLDLSLLSEKASFQSANRRYDDAGNTLAGLLDKGRDGENDFIQAGRAYYMGRDFDKADAIFSRMIAKYPGNLQGYMWAANTAAAKDPDAELGLAKPKFKVLLEKASADSVKNAQEMMDAMRYLGYNALQHNDYETTKAYYTRMLNFDPENKEYVTKAYGSLSMMYIQMGKDNYANPMGKEYLAKGIECNNKILAIDPNNENAKSTIQYINQLIKGGQPPVDPNQITGVIRDSAGQPIANASVRVKDTACEGWTNAKGEYKFVMPGSSETLLISAKGYKTIEVPVTKARVYNATLEK